VRLNLGCGIDILPGWVNVDASDQLGPSVEVWNLDEHPWPFDDSSVSEIRAIDIYEHVDNPVGFMVECWRVLQPGGTLRIQTAYWQCMDGYTDPTHKRVSTEDSFDFWVRGTIYFETQNAQMGGMEFVKIHVRPEADGQLHALLRKPDMDGAIGA
jgi:SAM-dependent methyltransferase